MPVRLYVSIHASAREATLRNCQPNMRAQFQSTPPRGRRQGAALSRLPGKRFNPRLREGGDSPPALRCVLSGVSIHASAREATNGVLKSDVLRMFQSTPPRGRRLRLRFLRWRCWQFQSTPPRGRRQISPPPATLETWFQSTPPRGRRPGLICRRGTSAVFQSTPPRGRRPPSIHKPATPHVFQSTPPRGRRPTRSHRLTARGRFNPRLREGGDLPCRPFLQPEF